MHGMSRGEERTRRRDGTQPESGWTDSRRTCKVKGYPWHEVVVIDSCVAMVCTAR